VSASRQSFRPTANVAAQLIAGCPRSVMCSSALLRRERHVSDALAARSSRVRGRAVSGTTALVGYVIGSHQRSGTSPTTSDHCVSMAINGKRISAHALDTAPTTSCGRRSRTSGRARCQPAVPRAFGPGQKRHPRGSHRHHDSTNPVRSPHILSATAVDRQPSRSASASGSPAVGDAARSVKAVR
jgi:hypothetical protein